MTEWDPRLRLVEALEADGWICEEDYPLSIFHKDGVTFGVTGCGDASLSGPAGWTVGFPADVPDSVILAACAAALHD